MHFETDPDKLPRSVSCVEACIDGGQSSGRILAVKDVRLADLLNMRREERRVLDVVVAASGA